MSLLLKVASNSVANLIAGVSKAAYDFLLPAILIRYMTEYDFSVWSISYQIVPYVLLFGAGVQIALAKNIASVGLNDGPEIKQKVLHTTIAIVFILFLCALLFVVAYSEFYPYFVTDSIFDVEKFKKSVYIMGFMTAVQLFALVPIGVMTAESRNFSFAIPQFFSRFLIISLIFYMVRSGDYYDSVFIIGLGNVLVSVGLIFILCWCVEWVRCVKKFEFEGLYFSIILRSCFAILVTMLSGAAINVVSISIVGFFDFRNVGFFSLAITVSTVIGGMLNSLISPVIPILARLYKSGDSTKFYSFFYKITVIGTSVVCLMALAYFFLGDYFLEIWVGRSKANEAAPYVSIIFYSNIFRFLLYPYAVLLLAMGCNRVMIYAALSEALMNLIFTLVFSYFWGAKGAAVASMIAGFFGFLWHLIFSMKLTAEYLPNRSGYLIKFILKPVIYFLPFLILAVYARSI